jgi:hypothetical protein
MSTTNILGWIDEGSWKMKCGEAISQTGLFGPALVTKLGLKPWILGLCGDAHPTVTNIPNKDLGQALY